jgi:hypothetical protein
VSTDIEPLDELEQTAAEARATASKAEQEAQTIRASASSSEASERTSGIRASSPSTTSGTGWEAVNSRPPSAKPSMPSTPPSSSSRASQLSSEAIAANTRTGGHERRFAPIEARDFDPLRLLVDAIENLAAAESGDAIAELLDQRERYADGEEVPEPMSEVN